MITIGERISHTALELMKTQDLCIHIYNISTLFIVFRCYFYFIPKRNEDNTFPRKYENPYDKLKLI